MKFLHTQHLTIALHYSKTLDFSVSKAQCMNNINANRMIETLESYIQSLEIKLNQILIEPSHFVTEIHIELTKLVNFISRLKTTTAPTTRNGLFGEINACLNTIATQHKAALPQTFNEFSEHIRAQYRWITDDKRNAKAIKKNYQFTVEQWKKEKLETFFLGDDVGCCLATTSEQFQAMVQRRMDDAMLFHVVTDQTTQRVVALAWLYLAETTDNKIVLVANFFEVNTQYAINDGLRLALLNGLLQFTHQYCEDNPKINAFYMGKLDYGWNKNDLNDYDAINITLEDKLGGAFTPRIHFSESKECDEALSNDSGSECDFDDPKANTQKQYYLLSLSQQEFHRFDSKKLTTVSSNSTVVSMIPEQESAPRVSSLSACSATTFHQSKKPIETTTEEPTLDNHSKCMPVGCSIM